MVFNNFKSGGTNTIVIQWCKKSNSGMSTKGITTGYPTVFNGIYNISGIVVDADYVGGSARNVSIKYLAKDKFAYRAYSVSASNSGVLSDGTSYFVVIGY